ncbi:MAG TPA: EAL domain-containing protein [Polyangiaceae bacterium]|jgi:EAL domain-containing protein (putative c-di-GMP-specific phosphodiesterase class I)
MASETEAAGKVLLIDDDPAVCGTYARMLRRLGLRVETATSGLEALQRVIPGSLDAVLVDIAMPGLDGVGVLRALRKRDPELPVVLMTGVPALNTALKAVEYGAIQYLLKPVDSDALAEAMWRAIDLRKTLRQRHASPRSVEPALEPAPNATLDQALDAALSASWLAFQPIVQVTNQRVFAYEALVRSNAALGTPSELFAAAERAQRTHELGRTIRRKVAESAPLAPPDALLFVNVHAEELNDNELLSSSAPLSNIADRVVLELTERSRLNTVAGVCTRLARLRKLGFRIALDDLGDGYAGLAGVLQLLPEFVKLDMSLIRDIDRSSRKRSLVSGVARVCSRELGIEVICEGVERLGERDVLLEDGLDLLQGYLFAKPAVGFPAPMW